MKKVITTVGTSLFNEYSKNRDYLAKNYSHWDEELNKEIKNDILKKIKKDWPNIKSHSAELKSLLKYAEDTQEDIEVYFITTDTVASNLAGKILTDLLTNPQEQLKVKIYSKATYRITDLVVNNYSQYKKGINNLIEQVSRLMDGFEKEFDQFNKNRDKDTKLVKKKIKNQVVFNVTGGFKGIIPMMTILAQLYDCELLYIFEESQDKITIPRIPINFDPFLTEKLYMELWEIKENKVKKTDNQDNLKAFVFIDDKFHITALGKLFMKMVEKKHTLAKSVLGYFIEYKIVDYLYKTKKANYIHSFMTKDINGKDMELDFVKLDDNKKIKEIWEVKSVSSFYKSNLNKVQEQFNKQIQSAPDLQVYKLIVYTLSKKIPNQFLTEIKNTIRELKNQSQNVEFVIEQLCIPKMSFKEQNKEDNPYKLLLKHSLKNKDFITIQLEDNNE